jgi:hypothetical protein
VLAAANPEMCRPALTNSLRALAHTLEALGKDADADAIRDTAKS